MSTYPFCYTPADSIRSASLKLIAELDSDGRGEKYFAEGKMLGVLEYRDPEGNRGFLYAFSGLADGKAFVEGFVPPIFDLTDPEGYFKKREAEIVAAPASEKAAMSAGLQKWIFDNYRVMNASGEEKSVSEIFALRSIAPPGGTGDCAAPKLLNYAFRHSLTPLAMGEFWYGKSPEREVRQQGRFYPSCTGKCGPLLTWMLQGLEVEPNPQDRAYPEGCEPRIIYSDESIIVADKPSGMLSVPGRSAAISLLEWLRDRFGNDIESCHRLDMDTSGLMVFARGKSVKAAMEAKFAAREVRKTYRTRLSAVNKPFSHAKKGTIALPLSEDWYDRPRQMVDFEGGKKAISEYEVIEELPNGEIEVRFIPHTGRSHQLRVHAAHEAGLGRPIKGDRLYGGADGGRLFLEAESLAFTHPADGREMVFRLPQSTL